VYGFGSFYRGEKFEDIDLLVVASPVCSEHLKVYYDIKYGVDSFARQIACPIDVTFLTYTEFKGAPLLEMDALTLVYESPEARLQ